MDTAETAPGTASSTSASQDAPERAVERAVNEQVRSQGLARAVEWRIGIPSELAAETTHQQVRSSLERMYASPAAAAGAENGLVKWAEERGIASALDRFMRKPHRFGRLRGDKESARGAAREVAPDVTTFLLERATRRVRAGFDRDARTELTPAQVRREREDRVLRAAARDRLRAAATRRWGFNDDDEYTNLLPLGHNVLERNPNGTVREYLAEPGTLLETTPPYSDVATRTTFVADRHGVPRLVAAAEAQTAEQLRPVERAVGRTPVTLPFTSPTRRLPGETPRGLRGRAIPIPARPFGRPQANRFHTCVACSYGKHSAYARNYDLCKDCHRIVGTIPDDLYRKMVQELKARDLTERRAESFGHTRSFAEVAKALTDRWRAENLLFGTSAGEPYIVYPQSDVGPRRLTLAADVDGQPLHQLAPKHPARTPRTTGEMVEALPFSVPASSARDRDLRPIVGVFPRTPRTRIDLAAELGDGLARSEDDLMISGDRSARSDPSPFEEESELLEAGRVAGAARLSDFTEQRPIEVSRGSGLSKEEIFALSDAAGGAEAGPRRRKDWYPPLAETPHSFWTVEEREERQLAVERHNRGHADSIFFGGPSSDDLTAHALAGALTPEQREEARIQAYERDRTEALHDDADWDRRRERLGISQHWREHNSWSGPLKEITPPTFNREFAGSTGVDESLDTHETNAFLSEHRRQVDSWLSGHHDQRVKEWLADRGISDPRTAARVAHALREGDEPKVVEWLEGKGVSRETYDRDKAWLDEVNPRVFHRAYPVNPPSYEIGDLTPETPIKDRLAAQQAARATEVRNWSRHGGALTRSDARAALADYREATAVSQDPLLPPTRGTVLTERGDAEGPRDAANARARLEAAGAQFRRSVARVFDDPEAFLAMFNTATPRQRTQILTAMRTAPATLESTFGAATRLRGPQREAVDREVQPADQSAPDYGQIVRSGAVPGRPATRAAEAAVDGRDWLEARRAYRRAVGTVAAGAGIADAVQDRRIDFRAATLGLFEDPAAFHRAFEAARHDEKRMILSMMAEQPEQLESRIGAAARLAAGPGISDPRWAPLMDSLRLETLEVGKTAAERGRAYLATRTRHAGRVRASLRSGRAEARAGVLDGLSSHFPEARVIDTHARITGEIDGIRKDVDEQRRMVARVERGFDGLVATANEFREQLKVVIADPEAFLAKLKGLTAAEKHRVFDTMQATPGDLSRPEYLGPAGRCTVDAPRFTSLVATHGRHYVDRSLQFRQLLTETAQAIKLPADASKARICSALGTKIEELEARASALAVERAELRKLDPGLAEQHERRVKEWLGAREIKDASAIDRMADALRTGDDAGFVKLLREHGVSREVYERDRAWIDDVKPDLGKAAAQWRTLDEAERVHVAGAYPHLAREMDRVEAARTAGASGVGRQTRATALKEHSGQHRARNKPVAGLEL